MNELDNKDATVAYVHSLLPKEKCDTSHNAQLALLTDEEIAPIIPELLEWFQDINWGVAKPLVPILLSHENLLIPHIIDILSKNDNCWQIGIMDVLIPHFTSKNKQVLRPYIEKLAQLKETDEDTLVLVEFATECLIKM